MAEATAHANQISQTENDEALAEIKKSGRSELIDLTPEQKAAWRKALEPLYADMASRVGKDTIDEFQKAASGPTQ